MHHATPLHNFAMLHHTTLLLTTLYNTALLYITLHYASFSITWYQLDFPRLDSTRFGLFSITVRYLFNVHVVGGMGGSTNWHLLHFIYETNFHVCMLN